jgi:hypothetical protein
MNLWFSGGSSVVRFTFKIQNIRVNRLKRLSTGWEAPRQSVEQIVGVTGQIFLTILSQLSIETFTSAFDEIIELNGPRAEATPHLVPRFDTFVTSVT